MHHTIVVRLKLKQLFVALHGSGLHQREYICVCGVCLYSLRCTLFTEVGHETLPLFPIYSSLNTYVYEKMCVCAMLCVGGGLAQSRFTGATSSKEPFIYWFFRVVSFLQSILCQFTNDIGDDCYFGVLGSRGVCVRHPKIFSKSEYKRRYSLLYFNIS